MPAPVRNLPPAARRIQSDPATRPRVLTSAPTGPSLPFPQRSPADGRAVPVGAAEGGWSGYQLDTPDKRRRNENGNLILAWNYTRAVVFPSPFRPGRWVYRVYDVRKTKRVPPRYSRAYPTEDEAYRAARRDICPD